MASLRLGRGVGAADAHAGGGLIDQVDGLVGQRTVGDVAGGHLGGGGDGLGGDGELVVRLVLALDAHEDLDGLLDAGLLDDDGLEAPLQGGVALDVLAVVVQGGGADGLQLAAGEGGLEDVGRVDGALGGARADQHVHLVDEEHAVAGVLDLLDDLLEALLELAAVLGARDERADVEGEQPLALQGLRHVAGDDALGQTLHDGGLADAGLADEHGVVLGPPGEDLDDALDLLLPADDGVELIGARGGREVDAELVDGGGAGGCPAAAGAAGLAARARAAGGGRTLREDAGGLGADPLEVDAQALQDAGRDALALPHQAEQQVLGADVVVVEAARLIDGEFDDLLGARREADLAEHGAVAAPNDELHGGAHLAQLHAEIGQHLGGDAVALAHEAEQQVLGADVVVVEALGLFLGEGQDAPGSLGELVKAVCHGVPPLVSSLSTAPRCVYGTTGPA